MGKAQYKTDKPQKERDPFDFYPTEPELARAALLRFGPTRSPCRILDAGAGTGVWGQVAKELWPTAHVTGVELQNLPHPAGYDLWYKCLDFREFQPPHMYDLIIGNPPFNGKDYSPPLWEQFFSHAWPMLRSSKRASYASVIWLLPVDIITGIERFRRLWLKYPMFVHAPCLPRPAHNGDGSRNTAFREEGIAVWRKNWIGEVIGIYGQWSTSPLVWRE
jgi:hypothetical protein